jgi:SHR-binding domain of vacuolar-sorting associated protein 13
MIDGVSSCLQFPKDSRLISRDKKAENSGIQLAVQVNGGRWSLISAIPPQGSANGVIRATRARWSNVAGEISPADSSVCELCYVVSPLDGDWGLLTRSLLLTSRFLVRNDSATISFEVKQTGSSDFSSVILQPGQTEPFHWSNYRLPELISVRPSVRYQGRCIYKWSGGFDPLIIGHLPLRIRKVSGLGEKGQIRGQVPIDEPPIYAVKSEIEIRPRTGGTGLNLSFREEDVSGEGALYRIENLSPCPIWFCQDDVVANPSRNASDEDQSDVARPSGSAVFALDIPFKQGKYSHRKAASLSNLLRVRLALAPFSTRAGIETTKVVSMTVGETVRLNPSKLMMLSPEIRNKLQDVRVIGVVLNDGPTRVLRLRYVVILVKVKKPNCILTVLCIY